MNVYILWKCEQHGDMFYIIGAFKEMKVAAAMKKALKEVDKEDYNYGIDTKELI